MSILSELNDKETHRLNDATPEEWDSVRLCPPAVSLSKEKQVGGDHYKNSEHQPLEIVLHTEGYEAFRGACLTKVYKYLQRHKGDRLEDYRKAQHILDWLVEETDRIDKEEREYEQSNGIY